MNKCEFFEILRKELSFLPENDIEERLSFYSEMIDDRMEEGLSEEEAVAAIGSVQEITSQIISETPLSKIAKKNLNLKPRLSRWLIVLLILGSPIWVSILISLFAVVFSVYASLWSVVISLWAVFVSLVASGLALFLGGIVFVAFAKGITGIACVGAALVCVGLGIFMFFGCKAATKGILFLFKIIIKSLKNCFVKKEVA